MGEESHAGDLMIYLVTGKIGSGKTLLVLTRIVEHLAAGGCAVTNIALNRDAVAEHLRRKFRRRLLPGQLREHDFEANPKFHHSIPFGVPALPVMVAIDEAHLYFNAAQDSTLRSAFLDVVKFLTQSRKAGIDVWMITQAVETLWRQFRLQALHGFNCRDMRAVKIPFFGSVGMLGLRWRKFDTITGETLENGTTPLDRRLFGLYDTSQMCDSMMQGLQADAEVWEPADNRIKRRSWFGRARK